MTNIFHKARVTAAASAFIFGAFASISLPTPANALTIYCTNCADRFAQATQMAKEIETAINTAQQLSTQINQYKDMLQQGVSLPSTMFNRMTGDLQQLQSLYQQGKMLSGGLTDFDNQFRNRFGDYNSYLRNEGKNPNSMGNNYKQWSEQGFDNLRVAMRASGMNVSSIAGEDALLSQMVQRSQNATGRMQAIQAGNEIAAQQVQQMMKLRQLLDTQIQSQSMWYAQQMERETIGDAATQRFLRGTVGSTRGKQY